MADQPQIILIQYDLRPLYYDSFHCLAADCRYTCCRGWKIPFDKKDYLRLKQLKCSPELDAALKGCLRRVKKGPWAKNFYGEFDLAGGYCPMMRKDGLCSLQLEQGHDTLPTVCKIFPRSGRYPASCYLERSLSPACEGVLELLWNLPDGVDFVSDPLPEEEWKEADPEALIWLRPHFQDIRSQCIDILQNRWYPLPQRILLMGLALKELVDGERDISRWLAHAQLLADDPETAKALSALDRADGLPMFLTNNIIILRKIYNPTSDFASVPDELCAALGCEYREETGRVVITTAPYLETRARYEEQFADREYFMENLIVALFFHRHLPELGSAEELWKSYVQFCNLYSFYRFMAVMSCREGIEDPKAELFRLVVCASRALIHNTAQQNQLRDELFQNDSTTLAHMAILLGG